MVLAKALDDICPTYTGETEQDKKLKIEDRIESFSRYEVQLDKEWEEMEQDAKNELQSFIKERDTIFSKIRKTNNSTKVEEKIRRFEDKKQERVDYLARKLERDLEEVQKKMASLKKGTKKYLQLEAKTKELKRSTREKIKKSEFRYNTIIKNTINSDNSKRVEQRLEQSKKVWERKFLELKEKHLTREYIHNNRRMEYDQIRIALKSFENEVEDIRHWCTLADITLKECYTEAIKRAKMVGRDSSKIKKVLDKILKGEI